MSDAQDYILTFDHDQGAAEHIAQRTAERLESKEIKLVEVVESLGDYINESNPKIRSHAVNYLAQVIGSLSKKALSTQQVQTLCQFFCDRIEDEGSIGGLRSLQLSRGFRKEMATMTFRALTEQFQDFMLRSRTQRQQILELLNDLMVHHRPALKELGVEAIVGISDLVSGEKDPRNLMIIFSILKVLMVEWDISTQVQTLFDAVFCYFPITFRPPKDDPFAVKAQDLKDRLRECISSSSSFAPHAFPQLVDKLDSTSPNVKKDVIQTITACVSKYSATAVSDYSVTLWDSLKYEILYVQEENLAQESLIALQAIAMRLGHNRAPAESDTYLNRYIKPIIQECNEKLQEPQQKQVKPVGDILRSTASGSPVALNMIIKAVLPSLLTLHQNADTVVRRRIFLEVLIQILDAAKSLNQATESMPTLIGNDSPLHIYKDRLFELFQQALMSSSNTEVSYRVAALRGLLRLCQIRWYIEDKEIALSVQCFDEVLLNDSHEWNVLKNEAIQALVEISKIAPSIVTDIVLPTFLARLPDSSGSDQEEYLTILEGLARLSVEKSISETLVRRLLNKLTIVLQAADSSDYPRAILSTLNFLLTGRDLAHDPLLNIYYEAIVVNLIKQAAMASVNCDPSVALTDAAMLETIGRLAGKIVKALDEDKRRFVALQAYTLFTDNRTPFVPLLNVQELPHRQRQTIILSAWLLGTVGVVAADNFDIQTLIRELTRKALLESVPLIRQYVLRQVALMINKFLPSTETYHVLDLLHNPSSVLQRGTVVSERTVPVMFWIAKALVLRLERTDEVLQYLLSQLADSACGPSCAKGFEILLAPDELLSKDNGAIIRLLAGQRVFNACVPHIARETLVAEKAIKPNYLVALSGILRYVPAGIIMPEIDTLVPLLLQSLDLEDAEVKATTVDTFIIITQDSPNAVEGHLSSLIGRLLRLTATREINTPKIRFNALRCLRCLPGKFSESVVVSYRTSVTRGMVEVLDDPKRHIRQEAAQCRAAWLIMDDLED